MKKNLIKGWEMGGNKKGETGEIKGEERWEGLGLKIWIG
jgi:hypothetical protein